MQLPTVRRATEPELLDEPGHDREELARSLELVTGVNRRLGGVRALRRHLRPLLDRTRLRLLDVGTGNGDVPRDLLAWARAEGARGWWGVGVDLHPQIVRLAARRTGRGAVEPEDPGSPPFRAVRGDGLALPFPDDAFHVALCTLTLHHFADEEAVTLCREMGRVASELVLVNDLERSLPNYLGARLLALTWWRSNPLTRNDGPLSVLRSFTADELRDIGESAGLEAPRVERHFPFRLVLEGGSG